MVAGTIVVRDRPTDQRLAIEAMEVPAGVALDPPELADEEFAMLEQFLARREQFDVAARQRVGQSLLRRFAERLPREARGIEGRLEALFAVERARRGGAMAGAR